MSAYSFCEGVWASGSSRWHVRRLTEAGRKLSGGIDTPSLCGTVRPPYGWDLKAEIDERLLVVACPSCAAIVLSESGEGGR